MKISLLGITGRMAGPLVAGLLVLSLAAGGAGAETVGLPGDAGTGASASAQLNAVACPSAGDCVTVGSYYDAAGHQQGLIESETAGVWVASEVNLSALNPLGNPDASLRAVACPAVGSCVAAGTYEDSAGNIQGLLLTQNGGAWVAARAPISGLNAYSDPDLQPSAISCTGVGNCVVVGSYNGLGQEQGLILTDSGGSWSAQPVGKAGLNASTVPAVALADLSCSSTGNCVAVGDYFDSSSMQHGLIETETNGSWSGTVANLSGLSAAANPSAALTTVACPAAGDCTAAGTYLDGSAGHGSYQMMVVSSTDSSWGAAAKAALPANADFNGAGAGSAQLDLYADSISCVTAGNCVVVGSYDATGAVARVALQLSEAGGVWSAGTEPALPAGAAAAPDAQLGAVSCWASGACRAVGAYLTSAGALDELVMSESGGVWSEASSQMLTGAQPESGSGESLACAAGGYCAAAGWGWDGVGMGQPDVPFVSDAPGAFAPPAATDSYTSASVSWSAPADAGGFPIGGYTVTANDLSNTARGGQVSTAAAGTTSATLNGLTPGDDYTFTVVPESVLGNGLTATSGTVAALASVSQIDQSLAALEHPKAKGGLKTIRKHGLFQSYAALEPGTVTARWYHLTRKHHRRIKTLIASASASAGSAQTIQLQIRLNAAGKRLAKAHRKLKITELLTFTPSGGTPVSLTKSLVLG
jgi:hypothetical protein